MTFLDKLEKSLQSDAPAYLEFLSRFDPKKKQVFAFYEGDEDSSFYHHFLIKAIDKDCELEEIVVGCKNNIIKLQKEFNWKWYNIKQIAFFVDQDLSYWLKEPINYGKNIFVTDEYSVENYIVNEQGFTSWLVHFEGFARATKQEIKAMVSEFETNITNFKEIMIPIMAKAIVAKRHDSSISLSHFKMSRDKSIFFNINNNHVEFKIHIEDQVLNKWKLTASQDLEIDKQIEFLKKNIGHYSVRGKWILSFMAEIGEHMRLNANIFAPSLKVKGKINQTCSVSTSQCLTALAPYCTETIPKRLENFLNTTYQDYLNNFK